MTGNGGGLLDKTMLMLRIETLEAELVQAKEMHEMSSQTIKEMAEQLGRHAGVFQQATSLSEMDVQVFHDILSRLDPSLGEVPVAYTQALREFFVFKLGTAYAQ